MVILIALVVFFGLLIVAMALTPLAEEEMERDLRAQRALRRGQLVPAKSPVPVPLVERRVLAVAVTTRDSNRPQVA